MNLSYLVGVLAAVVGLALSIGLHEVGHMLPAKRFGVKVTQWMIGFGPTLWSRRGPETEYGVKAIPLGGYIRMIGMYPPPVPRAADHHPGRFEALSDEAKVQAWQEVGPGEAGRTFYRLSVPRKVVVMLGGPTMNLLIAVVMFTVLLVGIGLPTATTTLSRVAGCLPASMTSEQAAQAALAAGTLGTEPCGTGSEPSPAHVAGLVAGDAIVSVNGTEVSQWEGLTQATRSNPGGTVVLGVADASGTLRTVTVVLGTAYRPAFDAEGRPTGGVEATGYLGVTPQSQYVTQPLSAVPGQMWQVAVMSGKALLTLPARVADLATGMLNGQARDPNSPVSVVGIGRISGEVAATQNPLTAKLAVWVSLMASLNLFLFLFNLLPILPLDGGHVAGALWEGLRRRIAQVRGRPDPGPVDVSRALPVAYGMAVLLIALSTVVILADVVNPISLTG